MKRRILLLMMTALLSVGAWAENLWTGETPLNYYGFKLTDAVSMSAGDVLTFTVSTTSSEWAGIKLKTIDMTPGWAQPGTELISTSAAVGTVKIVVTSEVAAAAADKGLWLDGNDCTVTSVDLEKKQATLNIYSSEEGTTVNYWGSELSKAMFGAVQTGDLLTVTVKSVGESWGANLKVTTLAGGNDNVVLATAFISPDALPTTVTIPFTDDMVTAAKSNGLYLNEGTYTYTSVDLKYSYVITIDGGITNGTVTASKSKAVYGETVTLTPVPDGNYALGTLTVTDESSASVTVMDNGDGTYSFTMPATAVTVNATFTHNNNLTLSTGKILCFNSTGGRVTDQRYYTDSHTLWVGDGEHNGWDLTIGRTATTEEFTGVTINFSDKQNIQLEIAYNDGSDKTYTKDLSSETSPVSINFSTAGITGVLKSIVFARKQSGDSKIVFTDEESVKMQIAGEGTYPTPRSSMTLTYETLEDTGNNSVTYDRTNKTFTIVEGDDARWAFWDFILPIPTTLYNGIYFKQTKAPAGSKIEIIYDGDGDNPQVVEITDAVTSETTYNVDFNKTGNVTRIRFAGAGTYEMGTCTVKPAKYLVTVSAAKYATFGDLGSPDVINYGSASGLKAYIAYVNGDKVKLEEVSKASANTAVILYADVEEATSYTVYTTNESASTTTHTNELQISNGSVTGNGSTIYVLANGDNGLGFYLVENGSAITAGKAYLEVSGENAASQFIGFGDDNETTGIQTVANSQQSASNSYYDLQGRRVAQPTKGLYIVNGKKVIIK